MTGVRIAITWQGDRPRSPLKDRAERAIQKGARSTGCFGSALLAARGNGVDVASADIVGLQSPSGSHVKNAVEMVARWLRIGGVTGGPQPAPPDAR